MIKKFLLLLNLLLVLFFGYKVVVLLVEIGYKSVSGHPLEGFDFEEIKKPSYKRNKEYRNFFGVKEKPASKKNISKQKDLLNELITKDLILRVQGIFILEDDGYAVISVVERKKRGKQEVKKVKVGDKIYDFSVTSIRSGSISLKNNLSAMIDLKIFKPFEKTPETTKQNISTRKPS